MSLYATVTNRKRKDGQGKVKLLDWLPSLAGLWDEISYRKPPNQRHKNLQLSMEMKVRMMVTSGEIG
jgi:hypothetical protein